MFLVASTLVVVPTITSVPQPCRKPFQDCTGYAFRPTLLPDSVLACARLPGFFTQLGCYLHPDTARRIVHYIIHDMEVPVLAFCYPT